MGGTVSDFIVRRLREWGVTHLYGYSGDGINGLMGALRRAGGDPRLIQPRHEELAAFMASAHAKYTASQDLPAFAYDEYAAMLGLEGLRLERKEDIERVWDQALAADRPVVINAYTDPEVPRCRPTSSRSRPAPIPRRCSRAIATPGTRSGSR